MPQEHFVFCPQYDQACEIVELNCRIFRCAKPFTDFNGVRLSQILVALLLPSSVITSNKKFISFVSI